MVMAMQHIMQQNMEATPEAMAISEKEYDDDDDECCCPSSLL
jgi:hypothetical protein